MNALFEYARSAEGRCGAGSSRRTWAPRWTHTLSRATALIGWGVPLLAADAPLQAVPHPEPWCVLADGPGEFRVTWHNAGAVPVVVTVGFQLFQASTSTAARVAEGPWKRLHLEAGQTILDTASLTLPAVRAETRFLVRWHDEQGRALGVTELVALPSHLLEGLAALAGDPPLALVDPLDQLQPLLRREGVRFEALDPEGLGSYRGRLALVGSDRLPPGTSDPLAANLQKCLATGVNVVWFRRCHPAPPDPVPLCLVRPGRGTLVLADCGSLDQTLDTAAGRRRLLSFARLAVNPEVSLPFPP